MKTRNRKQIRDRYLNYLDPNLNKNKFTKWEDEMIIEQFLKLGKKWSLIAKNFQGKTGDMVKKQILFVTQEKNFKTRHCRAA